MAIIEKDVQERLIALQLVTITGDIYRIVFGKQKLTTITADDENEVSDGELVLFAKEKQGGEDFCRYTKKYIEIEDDTSVDDDSVKVEAQSYEFFTKYELQSQTFNYKVVPTLDKGIKLIKTTLIPNKLLIQDGRLSDKIVKNPNIINKTTPRFNMSSAKLKLNRIGQLEFTL